MIWYNDCFHMYEYGMYDKRMTIRRSIRCHAHLFFSSAHRYRRYESSRVPWFLRSCTPSGTERFRFLNGLSWGVVTVRCSRQYGKCVFVTLSKSRSRGNPHDEQFPNDSVHVRINTRRCRASPIRMDFWIVQRPGAIMTSAVAKRLRLKSGCRRGHLGI